jgi:hypothetical protein
LFFAVLIVSLGIEALVAAQRPLRKKKEEEEESQERKETREAANTRREKHERRQILSRDPPKRNLRQSLEQQNFQSVLEGGPHVLGEADPNVPDVASQASA